MSRVEMMEFPYGQFLEVRMEYVLLRDNELEAKIMRIIEGWMVEQKKAWLNECAQAASDGKLEPPEPDYFVTLSYAQIMAQLYMFNSSRKGANKEVVEGKKNSIHRNTITKAMAALIEDKYVITRPNPNKAKEYEATQYTLNLPLIQKHMRLLPKNPMSYLGSNGRIDGVPCPNFFDPPKEIPCTKFVHGSGDARKKEAPCTKNVHPTQEKSAPPSTKKVQGDAQKSGHLIDKKIHSLIDKEKEKENPTVTQETQTSPQSNVLSPSLSQKNVSSFSSPEEMTPTKEAKPTPVDYALFDRLCRDKGYAADFKVPRNEKNNAAIKELREQGANAKQVEFVFNDIWDDKDHFWQQHRGKPSTVASQFTARIWKMTAPVEKRRTASGLTNWTEDKTMGVPAIVEPVVSKTAPEPSSTPTPAPTPISAPAKPKEPALPVGYTRLKLDKPARPRTAWARRQQAEK